MNRSLPSLLLPLLLLLATGCGPIRSTVGIIQAEQVLKEARELGAAELAPYPMTVAQELVRKAVEEQGYADYSTSWQLATEARDLVRATLAELPRADLRPVLEVVEPPVLEEPLLDEPAPADETGADVDPAQDGGAPAEGEPPETDTETKKDNPWLDDAEETP